MSKKPKKDTKIDILKKYIKVAKRYNRYPTGVDMFEVGVSRAAIRHHYASYSKLKDIAKASTPEIFKKVDHISKLDQPKVLIFDIETAPIIGYVWGLWDNTLGLNQVVSDWHLLSWSAKWLGSKEIFYADSREVKNIENDSKLLKGIWDLLDEADIVITQNGIKFDKKKLNARFIMNGFQPPSSYRHIDTLQIAKRHFGFTSNKLEYMTDKLCKNLKKGKHSKYPGFEMWKACMAGDIGAWKEMEKYNKLDVLSLEELYHKLIPWDGSIDFNIYHDDEENVCKCGSTEYRKSGFYYTQTGKFQKYACKQCGSETRNAKNLLDKDKKKALRRRVVK